MTRVRGEVERQLRDSAAPEEVHAFLLAHWARLMTSIFVAKGNRHPDWQAGWDTMNALLWSLAPKKGRKETAFMLRVLPSLLARLQEGCAALDMSTQERDVFFENLSMLHAAVVRQGLHAAQPATDSGDDALAGVLAMDGVDLAGLPTSAEGVVSPLDAEPVREAKVPELALGDRILLRVGAEDRAMSLIWLSPMGGMYLFANDSGLDALSLTRARLAEKFRQGEARLLGR